MSEATTPKVHMLIGAPVQSWFLIPIPKLCWGKRLPKVPANWALGAHPAHLTATTILSCHQGAVSSDSPTGTGQQDEQLGESTRGNTAHFLLQQTGNETREARREMCSCEGEGGLLWLLYFKHAYYTKLKNSEQAVCAARGKTLLLREHSPTAPTTSH